jgi:hypothetical protein
VLFICRRDKENIELFKELNRRVKLTGNSRVIASARLSQKTLILITHLYSLVLLSVI